MESVLKNSRTRRNTNTENETSNENSNNNLTYNIISINNNDLKEKISNEITKIYKKIQYNIINNSTNLKTELVRYYRSIMMNLGYIHYDKKTSMKEIISKINFLNKFLEKTMNTNDLNLEMNAFKEINTMTQQIAMNKSKKNEINNKPHKGSWPSYLKFWSTDKKEKEMNIQTKLSNDISNIYEIILNTNNNIKNSTKIEKLTRDYTIINFLLNDKNFIKNIISKKTDIKKLVYQIDYINEYITKINTNMNKKELNYIIDEFSIILFMLLDFKL